MNHAFHDFDWSVAPRYQWQEWVDASGEPVTVPIDDLLGLDTEEAALLTWSHAGEHGLQYGPVLSPSMRSASELRSYRPMDREHAALFREFADVDFASQDAVLAFATRYGLLGLPLQTQAVSFWRPDGSHGQHSAHGESLLQWAAEICMMREGLRLGGRKRTKEQTLRLKWLFDRHLQNVQARLGFNAVGKPKMLLEPLTLIAAMWLQLALDVTGDKRFVECKFCRKVFEISTAQTGFRSHREFCSASCKTLDYRHRQRTARAMAESGVPARKIAVEITTDIATVERWLKRSTGGSRKSRKREA